MSIKFSLTGFLLTCLFLQSLFAIDTKAQEIKSVKEVRVKLSFDQVSLIEAFQRIEKATNFIFIFNDHEIDKNLRISTSTRRDETLSDLLLEISRQAKIQFKQVNRNISVKKIADNEQIQPQIEVIIQTRNVTGKVIAQEDREGLPGVNVIEKGTNNGTVTDVLGSYSLDVNEGATLVFSSVGYSTTEVVVGNRSVVDLVMTLDIRQLEELVVVGYGEQKRINLTGAVDQVTPEDIQNRPIQNLTQGLMGLMPNVNINMIEGKPIHAPAINIRGATSIGAGGDALVLIDGVEGDISMLNPNDIESISVLKDASAAAVYGARGAFGVVLVTTKKPARNKLTVNYTGSAGINQPTVNQSQYVTDGLTWANMFVDAFVNWEGTFPQNSNKTLAFSQDYLTELERRTNDPSLPRTDVDQDGYYRYYHSTDWYGHLFKSQTFTTDHNISASGSSDNVSFMVSGRALNQDGLIRLNPDDYQLLNLRAKGIIDLTNWLQIYSNLDFSNRTYFNPQNCCDAQFAQLDIALEGFPLAPLYNPDGTLTHSGAYALGGYAQGHNGIDLDRNVLKSTTGVEAKFFQNKVRVAGDFSFQRTQEEIDQKRVPVTYSRSPGLIESIGNELNWLRITTNANNFLATNFYVEYHDVFNNKHDLRAVVGTNYEESTFRSLAVRRDGLIFPGATNLALALGQDIATSASYNKWAILGSFYRLNYIFDNRYLVELTGRYDGSSKFPENERYAFFPSASAGWRISSEPFWKVNENLISHLQLRASYGSMGNGNIPAYRFHQTFGISQSGRILDGTRPQMTRNPAVLPDGLTWETVTTSNFGINLGMLNNRLEFSGDMYIRETTDMFTIALTPPATFGASPPMGNYADLRTRGWESMISWRDNIEIANRPFSYNFRFFMADHKARVTRFNNPDKFLNNYYEGMVIGEIWGYETEGFFTSEEDIKNHASQSRFRSTSWGQFYPGDIKLRDLDGDGVIGPGSNTADNPGDQRIIGNSTPRFTYGIRLGAEWNRVFFTTFFQGVGKRDWYPSAEANFWGQYNRPYNHIPAWHLNEGIIWTEDNPDSFFPRYVSRLASSSNAMLRQTQTKYLLDASYLRLKNLQVGYHLPQGITSRLGMSAASVYFSGENLLSWSPLYKIADNQDVENLIAQSDEMARPNETIRQGYNYPMMRSLTLGLSLTF